MARMTDDGSTAPASTIETAQPKKKSDLVETLQRLSQTSGRSFGSILRDYARTAFGPGKLGFDEYLALGLYDPARHEGADLRGFVGLKSMRSIWHSANFRLEFYDLIRNKISMTAMLEAHGFPAIPVLALFCTSAGYESAKCLHSVETLRQFLTDPSHYPLFGKPENGFQSLGSASFQRYDAVAGVLVSENGSARPLDQFVQDVAEHYGDGYLFQPRVSPHPETKALCGERLSTVRVLTIYSAGMPHILRVCEKIPGGANLADNFWRPGNLLVQVDPASGKRGSAISGTGLDQQEHTHHPDTGGVITGSTVPNWSAVRDVALEGARLFPECALIGWDIAPVESGAVIVEVNVTPDLMLPQLADRRGMLDDTFKSFLEERGRLRQARIREVRKGEEEEYRPSYKN